jgi:MoaA/NifB/PqqE/SkfB family radical SAM enzyme
MYKKIKKKCLASASGRFNDYFKKKTSHSNINIEKIIGIHVNVIEGCNSRCLTCEFWKIPIKTLDYNKFKEAIDFSYKLIANDKEVYITFVGSGEPLLNKNICELINYSNSLGLNSSIVTNSLILSKKKLKNLIKSGITFINLSLESNNPIINDKIRGIKGHHTRVIKNIENFEQLQSQEKTKCGLGIMTVVTSYNLDNLVNLVKWVNEKKIIRNINLSAINTVFGDQNSILLKNNTKHNHLWPKNSKIIEKVYDELIKLKIQNFKILNSIDSLQNQKEFFLNPEKFNNNRFQNIQCNVENKITINTDGTINLCPSIQDNPIKIHENTFFYNKKIIQKLQHDILKCKFQNCHIKLNCR